MKFFNAAYQMYNVQLLMGWQVSKVQDETDKIRTAGPREVIT